MNFTHARKNISVKNVLIKNFPQSKNEEKQQKRSKEPQNTVKNLL